MLAGLTSNVICMPVVKLACTKKMHTCSLATKQQLQHQQKQAASAHHDSRFRELAYQSGIQLQQRHRLTAVLQCQHCEMCLMCHSPFIAWYVSHNSWLSCLTLQIRRQCNIECIVQVHDAILDDLVYPTEIVGKRVRYKLDGSRTLKVIHCGLSCC